MANYVFFVSANPRALILIASTFTGIEISHQIIIVLFGLSRKSCPLEYWSFTENFGTRADQFSMKKLVPGPIFMKNWSIVGPRFSA